MTRGCDPAAERTKDESALAGSEAVFPPSPAGIVGVISYAFGVPALALFYIAFVTTLWQKAAWRRLLAFLAPVGRMALTNYLFQTVICVIIFYGYGFGQFGRVGAGMATLIALGIFLFQIMMSALWLKFSEPLCLRVFLVVHFSL